MTAPDRPHAGARARKKAETRATLRRHALRLFLAKGFDATTVEEIAAAAGVSHMTFFRHFPSKESVVDLDGYDDMLTRRIQERPEDEDPLTALHRATIEVVARISETDWVAVLAGSELIMQTPALRAHLWEKRFASERMVVAALARRHPDADTGIGLHAVVAAYLAVVGTAVGIWVAGGGTAQLPVLVDGAFSALRAAARRADDVPDLAGLVGPDPHDVLRRRTVRALSPTAGPRTSRTDPTRSSDRLRGPRRTESILPAALNGWRGRAVPHTLPGIPARLQFPAGAVARAAPRRPRRRRPRHVSITGSPSD